MIISDPNGNAATEFSLPGTVLGPSLTPDGQNVIYFYDKNLFSQNIADNSISVLNSDSINGYLWNTIISPDGTQIASVCILENMNSSEVCLFDINNSTIQVLTDSSPIETDMNVGVDNLL